AYRLDVGTTVGGTQIFSSGPLSVRNVTVSGLPTGGGTIHTRLWSLIGGVWEYEDIPYTAAPAGNVLWVSAGGDDPGSCTREAPCREVRRALLLAGPGDTILVGDGTYLGFDVEGKHGVLGAEIRIAATGAGAQIAPTTDRTENRDTVVVSGSSYVVLDGLRSSGAERAAVRITGGDHVTVRDGVF